MLTFFSQTVNPSFFTSVPSFARIAVGTYPGATGRIMNYFRYFIHHHYLQTYLTTKDLMILVLAIMYWNARKRVRKTSFERFFATHHLFIIFYALLLIHGKSQILGAFEYWKWFIGPGMLMQSSSFSCYFPTFSLLFSVHWFIVLFLLSFCSFSL